MLTKGQMDLYLKRLGVNAKPVVSEQGLTELHQKHLKTIPFENLDIHLGRNIELKLDSLFDKLIIEQRGGFCYELNYLFYALLVTIGFKAEMLSAQVYSGPQLGPDFDHMLLVVEVSNRQFIADVGFGDSFITPLPLDGAVVNEPSNSFKVSKKNNHYTMEQRKQNEEWIKQFIFMLKDRAICEFEPMCKYQQTSPESNFTKKSVCSIATETGRKTISSARFIETLGGVKKEVAIDSPAQYRALLEEHFSVLLPESISVQTWQKLGFKS